MSFGSLRPGPRNLITDVDGITVGNAHDAAVRSGVSVILPEARAIAATDVRGGGPGTRETDALDPTCLVDAVDAVVLSGGSSYGLDAASGTANWLGARGRGFAMAASPLVSPVVPAAILFDLMNGGDKAWGEMPPYRDLARSACEAAGPDFALGNIGAGYGAQAGRVKGGLGSASVVTESGLQVGAIIASNPFGSVLMPERAHFWAAPYEMEGEFGGKGWPPDVAGFAAMNPLAGTKAEPAHGNSGANTTIGVVATNAELTPAEARRIAIMAQDGLARAIRPVHSAVDGDVVFVLATSGYALESASRPLSLSLIGALAADCVARAVARGVYEAETLGHLAGYRTIYGA
ncbi:MAG: peptidase T4 [Rhizobiales bacterium]|nr:peptidase T4 [Hyphomicrobiales bacterium]